MLIHLALISLCFSSICMGSEYHGRKNYIESYIESKKDSIPYALPIIVSTQECPGLDQELMIACSSPEHSCRDQCGLHSTEAGDGLKTCSCDKYCRLFRDCCSDFQYACPHIIKDAISIENEMQVTIECVHGYTLIKSCPPDDDTQFLDVRTPVIDLSTSLAYQSMNYLRCNKGNTTNVQFWEKEHVMNIHRSDQTRLCSSLTHLECSTDFKARDPHCDHPTIQFAIKTVCDGLHNEAVIPLLIQYLKNAGKVKTDSSRELNDTVSVATVQTILQLDFSSVFNNSCTVVTKVGPKSLQGRGFSDLIKLTQQGTAFAVVKSPSMFLDWCDNSKETANCHKTCPPFQVRYANDICLSISSYRINFRYPVHKEMCQTRAFLGRITQTFAHSISFWDITGVNVTNDGYWQMDFSLKEEMSRSLMTDPYLRPNMEPLIQWALQYRQGYNLNYLEMCPNGRNDLCKKLPIYNDTDINTSTETTGQISAVGKSKFKPPTNMESVPKQKTMSPARQKRSIYSDETFIVSSGNTNIDELDDNDPCCFCEFLSSELALNNSDFICNEINLLTIFVNSSVLYTVHQYHDPNSLPTAIKSDSWVTKCMVMSYDSLNPDDVHITRCGTACPIQNRNLGSDDSNQRGHFMAKRENPASSGNVLHPAHVTVSVIAVFTAASAL